VRKRFREKGHLCSLQVLPPQAGRSGLLFYLYPNQLQDQRKETMQQLASEFFETSGRGSAVVVARSIDRWAEPYDAIALLEAP
jgi:hypothetical protein